MNINVDCNAIKELVRKHIKLILVENFVTNKEVIVSTFALNFVTPIKNVKIFLVRHKY